MSISIKFGCGVAFCIRKKNAEQNGTLTEYSNDTVEVTEL